VTLADHTARFITGCYLAFPRFDTFTAYSMFYFAAASFSEMQRRLTPERASGGFLRAADAGYSSLLQELSPAACAPGGDYLDRVAQAADSINIAGLCNRARLNWYPVDLEDTVRAAAKLGLAPHEARAALEASLAGSEGEARAERGAAPASPRAAFRHPPRAVRGAARATPSRAHVCTEAGGTPSAWAAR
jgi:hypothetical protein